MDKYIYDESNGLWYELQGDYYIPCLTLPTEKEYKPIGLWGQRHKRYLQEHKRTVYISLLTSGNLNSYLADINEQAENMLCRLVKKMATKEKVTEQLKAENQMLWVQLMNNIHNRAMEVVNSEIIYQ
ncbi:TnpV protein [Thomasclavelia cocleata]|uniref:TnpV protein n=5 Tax=Thomasclavelia cocleata TaxID=69824 RepID=UPI00255A7EE4|nr:TnpV protein [Thomasclavelia cocleata]